MGKFRDLTGQRFGRLVVKNFSHFNTKHVAYWVCMCDCGKKRIVSRNNLTSGHTKSCGCLAQEIDSMLFFKHGGRKTRLYKIWCGIKDRCKNKNRDCYKNYGGRGITICNEWENDFSVFQNWALNHGYKQDLSIDRIDNNKGYTPENCRWTTNIEQQNNKRNNILINFCGRTQTLKAWCTELNLKYHAIYLRICRYKWSIEKAFMTPIRSTANETL